MNFVVVILSDFGNRSRRLGSLRRLLRQITNGVADILRANQQQGAKKEEDSNDSPRPPRMEIEKINHTGNHDCCRQDLQDRPEAIQT